MNGTPALSIFISRSGVMGKKRGREASLRPRKFRPVARSASRVRRLDQAMAENALHLVLQIQFLFLEGNFFELFRLGQVWAGRQVVNLLVQIVMLRCQLTELVVALQQPLLQLFEVCRHFRLLVEGPYPSAFMEVPYYKSRPSRHKMRASSSGFV